jgi:hypothetical protein
VADADRLEVLVRQLQGRAVAGRVNADGSIAAGSGFTVSKSGTGTYVVTFTALAPVAVVAACASGANRWAPTSAYTAKSVTVSMLNSAGAVVDEAFAFIAFG